MKDIPPSDGGCARVVQSPGTSGRPSDTETGRQNAPFLAFKGFFQIGEIAPSPTPSTIKKKHRSIPAGEHEDSHSVLKGTPALARRGDGAHYGDDDGDGGRGGSDGDDPLDIDMLARDSDDNDGGGGRGGDHDDTGRRAPDSGGGSGHVQDSESTSGANNAHDMDTQLTGSTDLDDGCGGGSVLLVSVGDDGGGGGSAHDARTWRDSGGGGGGNDDDNSGGGRGSDRQGVANRCAPGSDDSQGTTASWAGRQVPHSSGGSATAGGARDSGDRNVPGLGDTVDHGASVRNLPGFGMATAAAAPVPYSAGGSGPGTGRTRQAVARKRAKKDARRHAHTPLSGNPP